jgi:hypothetical protein
MSKQDKIETISLNGREYVPKDSVQSIPQPEGDYVIVRCRNAGVHAGFLKFRKDGVIQLENSRRLWRWWSKFTLSGLAICGVLESKISEAKFACILPKIDLTESDVCEVIYCTEEARLSIQSIKDHENE